MKIPALVLEWLERRVETYQSTQGDIGIPRATQERCHAKAEAFQEVLEKLKELS